MSTPSSKMSAAANVMDDETRRFVDDDQPTVLVEDVQLHGFRKDRRFHRFDRPRFDRIPERHPLACSTRAVVEAHPVRGNPTLDR